MRGTEWLKPRDCESGTCLEVRRTAYGQVALRNSVEPNHVVSVTGEEFDAFVEAAKAGFYDGLAVPL